MLMHWIATARPLLTIGAITPAFSKRKTDDPTKEDGSVPMEGVTSTVLDTLKDKKMFGHAYIVNPLTGLIIPVPDDRLAELKFTRAHRSLCAGQIRQCTWQDRHIF